MSHTHQHAPELDITPAMNARIAKTKGSLAKIRNLGFSPRVSGSFNWLVTPRLGRKER
jgi:hypothetical protein